MKASSKASLGAALAVALLMAAWLLAKDRLFGSPEAQRLEQAIDALLPPTEYDNDPAADTLRVQDPALGPEPVLVMRARRGGAPVAALLALTATDGYNGPIRLLVAVRADGRLAGVRVLAHRETKGMGDAIDTEVSGWIRGFDGKSLDEPAAARWALRKDGGEFDQVSSATVTLRAVVAAARRALEYFAAHRAELLAP